MSIVLATADFEVYHGVVQELRDRDVVFTTIELGDALPDEVAVVITAVGEQYEGELPEDIAVVRADPSNPREAVAAAISHEREAVVRRVVGVDPGSKPGIAVLDGEVVVAVFHVPAADAPRVIHEEIENHVAPVVRIGDGARLLGAKIISELDDVRVELVDETGTTPHLGTGTRGMGDVLAAVNIARQSGEPVSERHIEPTEGELQVIKDQAREQSRDNRAIPGSLARAVAVGELTVAEALDRHRDQLRDT